MRIICAPGVALIRPTSWVATTTVVPSRLSAANRPHQAAGHVGIDIAGRLVGDEQFGPVDDGAGDRDPLLLPARQGRRTGARPVGQSDPGQHLANRSLDLFFAGAGDPQRKRDIVEGRQVADQAEVLEHHADSAAEGRQSVALRPAQLRAEQVDPPSGRALCEVEKPEQRGLARAGRAGEEIEAAAAKLEVEVAQHFGARAVTQADAIEFRNG